jgi:hypothetical protein
MKKTFSILITLALVLSFSVVAATPVMAQSWLSGWNYRVEITIHSDKIDGALVDFPVLLYLSTSSGIDPDDVSFIFDELGAEKLKLAVTTGDGTTQCYVEIEEWDDANEQAWLWVKVPSINSSTDTTLYLYYDSTQPDNTAWVGDTNSTPAENVWDSDFMVVYHMADGADTSHVYDSTSYSHDGIKTGANQPQETTIAKMGVAQVFDGLDDEISLTAGDLDDLDTATIEICAKFHTISSSSDGGGLWDFIESSTDRAHLKSVSSDELRLYDDIDDVSHGTSTTDSPLDTTNWFQLVVTLDSGGLWSAYIDNTQKFTQDDNKTFADLDNDFQTHIGSKRVTAPLYHDGELDEFRLSKTVRSPAWIKATYHSSNDSLLSYGSQESPPPPGPPSRPVRTVYDLIISSTEGGSVTTPGEGLFPYSERRVVRLEATPDAGYKFVNWIGDVDTVEDVNAATTKITMNGDYSINATFATGQTATAEHTLTISSTMGGSVTTPGEGTFPYGAGTSISLVASPDFGYEFVSWTGGGITHPDSAATTITMNGDYSIKANFDFEEITTSDSTGGSSGPLACFIATAAYGTNTAEQIDVLREFRDAVLLESAAGSQFVALYYQLSPPIADFIAGNELLRTLVREFLVDPVVWVVEATGDIWRN